MFGNGYTGSVLATAPPAVAAKVVTYGSSLQPALGLAMQAKNLCGLVPGGKRHPLDTGSEQPTAAALTALICTAPGSVAGRVGRRGRHSVRASDAHLYRV